ncbi:MAG TPA: glycosyltransferase [Longimicrobiaceae bacterium]|nr:glycosyltransferase [Longimicrobiaceae bacterium]
MPAGTLHPAPPARRAAAPRGGLRSVAILEPIGDVGIGGYTHELAEGLAAAGVRVDVFCNSGSFALNLPRRHRLFPALGRPVHDPAFAEPAPVPALAPEGAADAAVPVMDRYFDVLDRLDAARAAAPESAPAVLPSASAGDAAAAAPVRHPAGWTSPRRRALALARHLKDAGYDAVWTQWTSLAGYSDAFPTACRAVGLPLVHTVHNVLPHECVPGDHARHRRYYAGAAALVVHSRASADALVREFPETAGRVVPSWHGTYSIFPRVPAVRARVRDRLRLADGERAFLCFGAVRPYKNVEGMLHALQDERSAGAVLVVAGMEWGYPEVYPGDRLGRTRRLARSLGVEHRVRLLPGPLGLRHAGEVFEACDAVAVPYLESYGSGVLLTAMTYRRHVLATRAGGMLEYLDCYPHTPLHGFAPGDLADGIARAMRDLQAPAADTDIRWLEWPEIAREMLPLLEERLHAAVSASAR